MGAVLGMLSTKVFIVCVILYFVAEKIVMDFVEIHLKKHFDTWDDDIIKGIVDKKYPWQMYVYALIKISTLIVGFFALLITIFNL